MLNNHKKLIACSMGVLMCFNAYAAENVFASTGITISMQTKANESNGSNTIAGERSKGNAAGNVHNIYTNAEKELAFDTEKLKDINNAQDAVSLMSSVVSSMSNEERTSVKAKDQLAYLAEEAAARAVPIMTDGDIIIDNGSATNVIDGVNSLINTEEGMIASSNSKLRKIRTKIRYETEKNSKVSVSKGNISGDVDVVEAVTPYAALEYEPKNVSELSVENTGTNKVKVEFTKADTTSKVNVKFPNVSSDGFKAIVNEKMIISGLLTAPLIIDINAIWTLLTSVVRRVTILDVENLSIL